MASGRGSATQHSHASTANWNRALSAKAGTRGSLRSQLGLGMRARRGGSLGCTSKQARRGHRRDQRLPCQSCARHAWVGAARRGAPPGTRHAQLWQVVHAQFAGVQRFLQLVNQGGAPQSYDVHMVPRLWGAGWKEAGLCSSLQWRRPSRCAPAASRRPRPVGPVNLTEPRALQARPRHARGHADSARQHPTHGVAEGEGMVLHAWAAAHVPQHHHPSPRHVAWPPGLSKPRHTRAAVSSQQ